MQDGMRLGGLAGRGPAWATTLVPAGGATIVEFKADYPGKYVFVDHSLGRVAKGAAGTLNVEGEADPTVFHAENLAPETGQH